VGDGAGLLFIRFNHSLTFNESLFSISKSFNGNLFVENYPLKERTNFELKTLERIQLLRRIEIAENRAQRDILVDYNKRDSLLVNQKKKKLLKQFCELQ
jgi:hypothetical protein